MNTNLENCTGDAQNTPITTEEDNVMAYSKQRVIIGFNDGKPIYKYISGNTQDERDIEVVRAFIESGRILDYLPANYLEAQRKKQEAIEKHNFFKYTWDWYAIYKEPNVSSKYKDTLIGRINRLCSFFGGRYIEDIQGKDVQEFLSTMSDLTCGTVGYYKNLLSQIFDSAIEDEIIVKNPAKSKRIKVYGVDSEGNKALPLYECQKLIELLPSLEKNEACAIALMLFAGLRREEMLGMRWEDIDFANRLLHVQRAVVITNDGRPEVKCTKTKSSKRPIPMSDLLIGALSPYRKDNGYIVTDEDGDLFIDRRYKKFWSNVRKHTGIPNLNAPILRHTFATMNVASGVDMKTVMHFMGHTKISTTAEIYTQVESAHAMDVRNNMSDYVTSNIRNVPKNVQ